MKDEHNWFKWPYKRGKITNDDKSWWDFRMWQLAVLTEFSYWKMYGRFAGAKKRWL